MYGGGAKRQDLELFRKGTRERRTRAPQRTNRGGQGKHKESSSEGSEVPLGLAGGVGGS